MKYLLHGEKTERLEFRSIDQKDYDEWLEFHKDPNTRKYWISEFETPEIECTKWYERQFSRYKNDLGGMNALILKETNELVGYCGLLVQTVDGETELEIGYSMIPKFWNNAFATEAAQKCRDFAFENNFTENLISIISISNLPSQRVAVKNGMKVRNPSVYKGNDVFIFNIYREDWLERNF